MTAIDPSLIGKCINIRKCQYFYATVPISSINQAIGTGQSYFNFKNKIALWQIQYRDKLNIIAQMKQNKV